MTTKRYFTVSALLAMASFSAMANTISFTGPLENLPPSPQSFTLPNYVPIAGATLTGIEIDFNYSTTGEVDIFNSTTSVQPFTNATSSIPLTLTADVGVINLTGTANAVAGPVSGTVPAGPGTTEFPGLTGTGTLTIIVPSIDFVDFTAPPSSSTDSYSIATGTGSFQGNAAQGVFFGGSSSASGQATITYTYTIHSSTPEPASMALMGSALLGLGLLGKRLKKG